MSPPYQAHFAGPGQPGHLRQLLAEHIAATPAGGYIHWVTYYFRDRRLAQLLIDARRRGVTVTVCLAARPRSTDANKAVIDMLAAADGLGNGAGAGLRLISLPGLPAPAGRGWNMQLHEKLYCFSHSPAGLDLSSRESDTPAAAPCALLGSFNPSGDAPENRPDIIREIGDQDRGYNYLVSVTQPQLTAALTEHARHLYHRPPGLGYRFTRRARRTVQAGKARLYFWPRLGTQPLIGFLNQFGKGAQVRIAASHIRAPAAVNMMRRLAERGARLAVLASASQRRVPEEAARRLLAAGIDFQRIGGDSDAPMHLKFALVACRRQRWSVFGSANWTWPSLWLNHELAIIADDHGLYAAFDAAWQDLKKQGLRPQASD